jgi:hypothetical protein
MSLKVNQAHNHLPLFPPMVPPVDRPVTPATTQETGKHTRINGKSKTSGTGSHKVGTQDAEQVGTSLHKQLPDAVEGKKQQQGFDKQDSFRSDEVKQAQLQQQTIGQGVRHKQTRMIRQLATAGPQGVGFSRDQDVSGSQTRIQARSIRRGGALNHLRKQAQAQSFSQSATGVHRQEQSEVTRDVQGVDLLAGLLQSDKVDPQSQVSAAHSLGNLKQPEASPALVQAAYGDTRWEVREAAKGALGQLSDSAESYLQQHFSSLAPEAQSAALDHLARTPTAQSMKTFFDATESGDASIRHKGLKKLESALMYERTDNNTFQMTPSMRQQVLNTAARLSHDSDHMVRTKASDLLYLAAQR